MDTETGSVDLETGSVEAEAGSVGANYALHKNFLVGLAVGPLGQFNDIGSSNAVETIGTIGMYSAVVGTFVSSP